MNNTVYEETKKTLLNNSDAVVVSIVETQGSSPGKVGCKMLVCPNGKTYGTIGGGNLEKFCTVQAQNVFDTKESFTENFKLNSAEHGKVSMICGGSVTVSFTFFDHSDTDIETLGKFFNIEKPALRAIIFGGGHVGKALCPILSSIGFDVYILDDRKEFANPEVHPQAKKCILCDYSDISSSISISENDYIMIMTHGHCADREILLQVCKTNATYIGCIGSRKKIESTNQFLLDNGISTDKISKIHSPIGLPIGGNSPEEIAISIAAQVIQHKYQFTL